MTVTISIPKEFGYSWDDGDEMELVLVSCDRHSDCAVFELGSDRYHIDAKSLLKALPLFCESEHDEN